MWLMRDIESVWESYPPGAFAVQPRREAITKAVLVLALLGFGMRLILLGMPIVEKHSQIRQSQTANAAQSYVEHQWWPSQFPSACKTKLAPCGKQDAILEQSLAHIKWCVTQFAHVSHRGKGKTGQKQGKKSTQPSM